jgi:hypothetical protein
LVETIVATALDTLAGGNVFPDVAPAPYTTANPGPPWITYQAAGGQSWPTLDNATPSLRNSRVRINVWSLTRLEAAEIMEQVFKALVNPSVCAVPIGSTASSFEDDTLLYGSLHDFSISYLG